MSHSSTSRAQNSRFQQMRIETCTPNTKYNDLTLSDKIYFVFQQSENTRLSFDELNLRLNMEFHIDIDSRQIQLRFLYCLLAEKGVQWQLQSDDFCPNGAACQLPVNACKRLHYVSRHSDPNSSLLYTYSGRMTDKILIVILLIFNNRTVTTCLSQCIISGNAFIETFNSLFGSPIPNMHSFHNDVWRKIIDSYNKYYFDYQQQMDLDLYQSEPYIILWRTQNVDSKSKSGFESWGIRAHHSSSFFEKLTCFRDTVYQNCQYNDGKITFCPFFHLQLRRNYISFYKYICILMFIVQI